MNAPRQGAGPWPLDDRDLKRRVEATLDKLKKGPFAEERIAVSFAGTSIELLPFTREQIDSAEAINLLTKWRRKNLHGFTKIFDVTVDGTRAWAISQLITRSDRVLFFVCIGDGELVGHVGLSSFDFQASTCEIDNIVRGEPSAPKGVMQAAVKGLLDWTYDSLMLTEIRLRTLSDNARALALYHRIGFVPASLHPLRRIEGADFEEWVDAGADDPIDRFMLGMLHVRRGEA